jgi:hypothetical protein
MILKFSTQPDSPHSQILRKAGQKKTEPNRPVFDPSVAITVAGGDAFLPVIGHVRTASYGWRR